MFLGKNSTYVVLCVCVCWGLRPGFLACFRKVCWFGDALFHGMKDDLELMTALRLPVPSAKVTGLRRTPSWQFLCSFSFHARFPAGKARPLRYLDSGLGRKAPAVTVTRLSINHAPSLALNAPSVTSFSCDLIFVSAQNGALQPTGHPAAGKRAQRCGFTGAGSLLPCLRL